MELPVQQVDFEQHMREKARMWKPFTLIIGEDFAVFEFDNVKERSTVVAGLAHYASSYGYDYSMGDREQLVIVKGEKPS